MDVALLALVLIGGGLGLLVVAYLWYKLGG